jgi:hypothetical protein
MLERLAREKHFCLLAHLQSVVKVMKLLTAWKTFFMKEFAKMCYDDWFIDN